VVFPSILLSKRKVCEEELEDHMKQTEKLTRSVPGKELINPTLAQKIKQQSTSRKPFLFKQKRI